jgi:GntR family transcriptional regulator, transcriptional repressor for pyruvate dehydrogenase complex
MMDTVEDAESETAIPRSALVGGRGSDNGGVKLSDLVYAKIAGHIRSGKYPVDSRLPAENELADGLGVSRPVVREALARLRNDGVVVSRRGSGTYVQQAQTITASPHPPLTSISDLRRCLEFRISVEGEAAWHAARGDETNREALHRAMDTLERDLAAGEIHPDHDFSFHLGIALASGNRFFSDMMIDLRSSIMAAMAITPNFTEARSADRLARIHAEHRAVYDAIVDCSAEAARDAMRGHLIRAMNRVFEGI